MLAQYSASVTYLLREMKLLGEHDGFEESRQSQVNHLISTFRDMPVTLEDVSALQDKLGEDTHAFTEEQRKKLGKAISELLKSVPAKKQKESCNQQSNNYTYNYHTDKLWSILVDPNTSVDTCHRAMADEGIQYGYRNPKELDYVRMNSTIQAAKNKVYAPDVQYQQLWDFKEIWVSKRTIHPGEQSMSRFPQDAKEFMLLYHDRFHPDEPPVPSRVLVSSILEIARAHPARDTHRKIATLKLRGKQAASAGAVHGCATGAEQPGSHHTSAVEALTSVILRQQPLADSPPPCAAPRPASPLPRPSALAAGSGPPRVTTHGADETSTTPAPALSGFAEKLDEVPREPAFELSGLDEKIDPSADVVEPDLDSCSLQASASADMTATATCKVSVDLPDKSVKATTSPTMTLAEMRKAVEASIDKRKLEKVTEEAKIAKRRKDAALAAVHADVEISMIQAGVQGSADKPVRRRLTRKQPADSVYPMPAPAPRKRRAKAKAAPAVALGAAAGPAPAVAAGGEPPCARPPMTERPCAYRGGKI